MSKSHNPRQYLSHLGTVRRAQGGGTDSLKRAMQQYTKSSPNAPTDMSDAFNMRMQSQQADMDYIRGKVRGEEEK
jgi:hypothetical protein